MIPYLFEATYPNTSRTFIGHGIGDLVDATDVMAEESSDDDAHEWELSFTYPDTGDLFSQLTLNNIVVAKANNYMGLQAFRIYSITKNINHTITVACQHISYDLGNIPVKPFKAVGASEAFVSLKANMLDVCNKSNFIFSTDLPTPSIDPSASEAEKKDVTIDFSEPKNALKIVLDGDDSIKGKYGGDLITDNYDISLYQIGGSDRGITIEYGIDLVDLDQERNITNMITGILPYYVRAKDTRLDIDLDRHSDVIEANQPMVINTEAYMLEAGCKYTLTFTPDNTGGTATLLAASGFSQVVFSMDGNKKEYEIIPQSDISVSANTTLIQSTTIPYETEGTTNIDKPIGALNSFSITKNYTEPILYGDIVNGPGTYPVQKISSVDLSEYFQDSTEEPTSAQITAKGEEWVAKEEIGEPEVSLTVSYASLEGKDVRLYDAVRVRFVKMGIDVKSKVTKYKYNVLTERCTEIEVGKTKDTAIFTLQDASRLRKGLLPPDRIADNSVNGNKLKKGSVGADQIGSIGKWNMPVDIIDHDLLSENAVTKRNLSKTGNDPVLGSVPNNVYGGYDKKVGYLLDPSLGIPPDNLFGWSYRTPQGERVFKNITKWSQRIPYDQGSGVGYVLDPDFILNEDIDGETKLAPKSVGNTRITDGAIDEKKLSNVVDPVTGKSFRSKIVAWENLYDGVGPEAVEIGGLGYMDVPRLQVTTQLYIPSGSEIAMETGVPGYGSLHGTPHPVTINGTRIGYVISDANITITIPSDQSQAIININKSLYGYIDAQGQYRDGVWDIIEDHEQRISALEGH